MSKMNEIGQAVGELRSAAQLLSAAADSLTSLFRNDSDDEVNTATNSNEHNAVVSNPSPVTLEQVRAALAEKSRDGFTDEVRALLHIHGANKLSEIDPGEYEALLTEVGELAHE